MRHDKLVQIRQLLALAASTTFPAERESAEKMARRLMEKYSIPVSEVMQTSEVMPPRRVVYAAPGMHVTIVFAATNNITITYTTTSSAAY